MHQNESFLILSLPHKLQPYNLLKAINHGYPAWPDLLYHSKLI